jgi:hypothetical protein
MQTTAATVPHVQGVADVEELFLLMELKLVQRSASRLPAPADPTGILSMSQEIPNFAGLYRL